MKELTLLLSVLFVGSSLLFTVLWLQPDSDLEKEEREASELNNPFHGKLKPCPFCGAEIIEAAVTMEGYTNVLLIHCSRCGTDFELHEQDRDTYTTIDGDIYQIVNGSPIDLWNTRASDGKGGK